MEAARAEAERQRALAAAEEEAEKKAAAEAAAAQAEALESQRRAELAELKQLQAQTGDLVDQQVRRAPRVSGCADWVSCHSGVGAATRHLTHPNQPRRKHGPRRMYLLHQMPAGYTAALDDMRAGLHDWSRCGGGARARSTG